MIKSIQVFIKMIIVIFIINNEVAAQNSYKPNSIIEDNVAVMVQTGCSSGPCALGMCDVECNPGYTPNCSCSAVGNPTCTCIAAGATGGGACEGCAIYSRTISASQLQNLYDLIALVRTFSSHEASAVLTYLNQYERLPLSDYVAYTEWSDDYANSVKALPDSEEQAIYRWVEEHTPKH